jgi:copper chaperone CopZ
VYIAIVRYIPPGCIHQQMTRTSRMPPSSLSHTTYLVAGMTCEHCRVAVTEEVTEVAGVASVDVDLDSKLVRVSATDVDEAAVIAAIDEAGYDAVPA